LRVRDGDHRNEILLACPSRRKVFRRTRGLCASHRHAASFNLCRRSAVDFGKDGVEAAKTAETCAHRDLGHRQIGIVEQSLCALHPRGLCDLHWAPPRISATPVSNRLIEMFGREVPDLTGDRADFEALFDRFEILTTLSCAHQREPADFDPAQIWFPLGLFATRRARFYSNQTWFDQADAERDGWHPLAAGLFGGSFELFSRLRAALENFVRRTGWW